MSSVTAPKPSPTASDRGVGEYEFEGSPRRPAGIGERLALAIRVRFASIAEFARASGISEGLVRQHIHRATVPAKHITTYVRFLKVTPEWLLDGKGVGPVAGTNLPIPPVSLPIDLDREALRLAISAADVLARNHPLTDDQRTDLIADLTPVLREKLSQARR